MNTQAGREATLDPQRQRQAARYARQRRRLMLVELLLGAAYLAGWLVSGAAVALQRALTPLALPWGVTLLLYAALLGLPYALLTFPLRYYSGFTLPHRYGLSTQDLRAWLLDLTKGGALSLIIGAPLLIGLYALMRASPGYWWLWAGGGFTLVSAILTAVTPMLILPLFYKQEPLNESRADLVARLRDLAQAAGAAIEGVYRFDMSRRTRAANAALVGLGGSRRILIGDTLLEGFSDEEIESVIAHELGHHVHGDIPLSILVQSALNLGAFALGALALGWSGRWFGFDPAGDPASLPALGLAFGAAGLLTLPLGNAFSRWREALADDFALQSTHDPQAFAAAMTRLANQNLAEAEPARWVVVLLHSHPPLHDRIRKARRWAAQTRAP